jgi:hypothetical protein
MSMVTLDTFSSKIFGKKLRRVFLESESIYTHDSRGNCRSVHGSSQRRDTRVWLAGNCAVFTFRSLMLD